MIIAANPDVKAIIKPNCKSLIWRIAENKLSKYVVVPLKMLQKRNIPSPDMKKQTPEKWTDNLLSELSQFLKNIRITNIIS